MPIRGEASDKSEIVSQLLFGDSFSILEQTPKWIKISTAFDQYEGWIDSKQFQPLTEEQFLTLEQVPYQLNGELIDFISYNQTNLIPIPLGSDLRLLVNSEINTQNYQFEGTQLSGIKPKKRIN